MPSSASAISVAITRGYQKSARRTKVSAKPSFAALLAEGSLSGAARALGLTQPTVARHLDQLEAALGALGKRLVLEVQDAA
jgi:DNA-binding MarR family transcriptional regulator